MTEDEARTVAALAAQCVWGVRSRWELIMRYGRLFTPGPDAGGGAFPKRPLHAGRNAYRWAMDSGLLYAEGFACPRDGLPAPSAWCLDGETVVDPGSGEPGTAYFGVALRSDYMRRNFEAHRYQNGTDGFRQVLPRNDDAVINPPVDPAADIVWDLGRDIPSWVREWALAAEPPPGGDPVAPAWVLDELLRFPDVRAAEPVALALVPPAGELAPGPDAGVQGGDTGPAEGPLPMSYARYLIRRADWLESGMSLVCSGRTGGVNSDNAVILEEPVRDGDGLDTLMRIADEHRSRCEWAVCPADEREHPELTAEKHAEVHLRWHRGRQANTDFAVLHRLDYQVWDAWLHPSHLEGVKVIREPPELLTRNGVSYEMALTAVVQAMGDEMPEGFGVLYL